MPQGPLVLLGIEAGDAIGRDLDAVVAIAQTRYGVQHANIRAIAHHHHLVGLQLGQRIGQSSLEKAL